MKSKNIIGFYIFSSVILVGIKVVATPLGEVNINNNIIASHNEY